MSNNLLDEVRDGVDITFARIDVDRYHRMIDAGVLVDGEPIELIRGSLVYKDRRDETGSIMTHGSRHLKTVNFLASLLFSWVANQGAFVQVQGAVRLSQDSEPEPDCSVIRGRINDYEDSIPSPADILVVFEVAHSSLPTDRKTKLHLYAESGIPVYVILNLRNNSIEVYSNPAPDESRYARQMNFAYGDTALIPLSDLGELQIQTTDIFPKSN